MKTILYWHNSSEISGGERSLLALWCSLDREAFRPVLLIPTEGVLAERARAQGLPVHVLPMPSWRAGQWGSLWRAYCTLSHIMKQESVDIIHSYTPRNNLMAWAAARLSGSSAVKVVWHERNIPQPREKDISRMFQDWPDAIICNSARTGRRFRPGPKIHVIRNGVDVQYFAVPADKQAAKLALGLSSRKLVGVVANFSPRKGLETFLEVAGEVAKMDGRVSFIVVGGYYGADSLGRDELLKKMAIDLGLSGRIVWAGFHDDIRPLVAAMDVVCHPTREEACSRAILECMAMARPVVAFADGGNPEIMGGQGAGVLVSPGDVPAMVKAVKDLLNDELSQEKTGSASRERVTRLFPLALNAQKTMELYRNLCG